MSAWSKIVRVFILLSVFGLIEAAVIFYYKKDNSPGQEESGKREYIRENFEEQVEVIKELEPLMEEIRGVMKGEIQVEDENPLSWYEFCKEDYEDVVRIEAYVELVSAELEGDKGTMLIEYDITYYDIDGYSNMHGGSIDTEIVIEKDNEHWKIVKVLDTP